MCTCRKPINSTPTIRPPGNHNLVVGGDALPALTRKWHGRSGRVAIVGRSWTDDDGPFYPLGATLFWALHGLKFEEDRLRQNLAWLKGKVDYIRVLGQVGWTGNEIDPRWDDYRALLNRLLDICYLEYGLRVQITCWGGGLPINPLDVANTIADTVVGRERAVLSLEAANESFQNGPSDDVLRGMCRRLIGTGIPTAPSSPGPATPVEWLNGFVPSTANFGTVHLERTMGDYGWRPVRQPWGLKDLKFPIDHNEPIGPRSSVAEMTDPFQLAMLRAVGIQCGAGAFVLHNGAGVAGIVDPAHNRPANLWEVPGIDAIVSAVRAVEHCLPPGIENWQRYNNGWPGHPLNADAFFADAGTDHGVNRNYASSNGREFVTTPNGVRGYVVLTASQPCTITVYNPTTAAIVDSRGLAAGETYRLTDALPAYIIHGTR
jgi:hypothetical protein